MHLCFAEELRALEERAQQEYGIFPGTLMDSAAEALYEALIHDTPSVPEEVLILCGGGNNGADGYTLAALCRERDIRTSVISVFEPTSPLCRERAYSCNTLDSPLFSFEGRDRVLCENLIRRATVIVDCVFGIGYDIGREPDPRFSDLCRLLSDSNAFIISADVPSGLDSDSGAFYRENGKAALVFADLTVTFTASKPALETAPGLQAAGKVKCVSVGIPEELLQCEKPRAFLADHTLRKLLPKREDETSKANYGKLLSYCGSRDMPGAALLASLGALRCGVGLLTCTGYEDVLNVLKGRLCEPIYLPFVETFDDETDLERTKQALLKRLPNQSALLIGCGIGTGREQELFLEFLLSESNCPVVCDADALTILSAREDLLETYGEKLILTPHPGEMARLCHTNATEVQLDRIRLATAFSARYGCTVVLKGNRTVVSSPDGRLCINPFGNPGMAKAGMGDLLSGMIAAFAAQKVLPFDAATLGVYLHAKAGDLCRDALGEMSMLTHDVADFIGRAARE